MSAAIAAVAVSAIGVGLSAYGASQQASAQKKAGSYAAKQGGIQQAQDEYTAKQIIEQAQEKARQVRSAAIKARGTQVATAAASGVLVGDGSTQTMVDEVTNLAEQDAVAYLWEGANGSMSANEQGRLARMQGEFNYQQSQSAARATLIQGYGQAASQLGQLGLSVYGKYNAGKEKK
jgi:hypothetical protein